MTENPQERIAYLQSVIDSYAQFFLLIGAFFFAATIVVVIVLIKYAKSRRKIESSSEYLRYTIRGQEAERAHLARELHDTVAQNLAYGKLLAEEVADDSLKRRFSALFDDSISELRNVSYSLSPSDLTKNDFVANVKSLCEHFTAQNGAITFRLTVAEPLDTTFLNEEDSLNLYRIVQESLTNIAKHARATEATVYVRNALDAEEAGLYIFVSDDGAGFSPQKEGRRGTRHFGLSGMEERAALIGARLSVFSERGEGTQISVFKPQTTIQTNGGGAVDYGQFFYR